MKPLQEVTQHLPQALLTGQCGPALCVHQGAQLSLNRAQNLPGKLEG